MSQVIDMAGQVIGKLTILSRDNNPPKQNRGAYWFCQCECGNIKSIRGGDLRTGRVVSCGCYNKEINRQLHLKDLINCKFGKLTVIQNLQKTDKSRHNIWLCKCDCGTILEVSSDRLVTGNTSSCGCMRSKGEEKIGQLLQYLNLPYIKEKTFETCRNPLSNGTPRFDFYVNDEYLIEYDGIQHFQVKNDNPWMTEEQYQSNIRRDSYKNQWCLDNGIPLIRIPYTHLQDLCEDDVKLETSKYLVRRKNI